MQLNTKLVNERNHVSKTLTTERVKVRDDMWSSCCLSSDLLQPLPASTHRLRAEANLRTSASLAPERNGTFFSYAHCCIVSFLLTISTASFAAIKTAKAEFLLCTLALTRSEMFSRLCGNDISEWWRRYNCGGKALNIGRKPMAPSSVWRACSKPSLPSC